VAAVLVSLTGPGLGIAAAAEAGPVSQHVYGAATLAKSSNAPTASPRIIAWQGPPQVGT
jgi:hypothetical protein